MSSLAIFPVEILECITGTVIASEQMRLWQCGDRVLNVKLRNGGLKRTSLCWSRSSWMPWPRWYFTMFSGLQDIEWSMDLGSSICPTLDFSLLPKTLTRLHIDCADVFVLLRIQKVHMGHLLPMLHTLHLIGDRISEENLKNLPPNLNELHMTSGTEELKSSTIFSDLPRTLQSLKFSFWVFDLSEHENRLPEDLKTFDIYGVDARFNWFPKLPKSLKSLSIYHIAFQYKSVVFPPLLEELNLDWHSFKLSPLPQSLKSLDLREICESDAEAEDGLGSLLPKNLTSVRLKQVVGDHDFVRQLAGSVIEFKLTISPTHPRIMTFFHPETISLHLGRGPYSKTLKHFPFPTKLQYLRVYKLNDEMCAMLPPGLQTLKIDQGCITTEGASKLPKSLTSLITDFNVFDNNEAISHLGCLSSIELRANTEPPLGDVNSDWLSTLLPSSSPAPNHGSLADCADTCGYNLHLTTLILDGTRCYSSGSLHPYVQKSFFEALQKFKNLTHLRILPCEGISSEYLCLIPQKMTRLYLRSLDTYPTETQLSALPTCLKYLDLEVKGESTDLKCTWNDEALQSLPRSLQEFKLNGMFPNLTRRMYEYLPANLKSATLPEFVAPLGRLYREKLSSNR